MERTTPLEYLARVHETRHENFYGSGAAAADVANACGMSVPVARGALTALENGGAVTHTDDSPAFWYITDQGLGALADARALGLVGPVS